MMTTFPKKAGKHPGSVDRVVLHHVLGRPLTKTADHRFGFCREQFAGQFAVAVGDLFLP